MRPPAREIALTLRRIADGKQLTLDKYGKDRPETWLDQYRHEIDVLGWAAIGYDKLAEKEQEGG